MSAITERQKNNFIFALYVALSAARGLQGGSGVLRSIVYRDEPFHRRNTQLLAWALPSWLIHSVASSTLLEAKREKAGHWCDNFTYS